MLEKLDCVLSKSATRAYIYEYKCECVRTHLCIDRSGRPQSPVIRDSPPAIRVISGHKMAEPYHAILPLLLYTAKQEKNEIKQSDSHSSLLEPLRKWAGKEYYRSLRMAIHKETKKSASHKKSETTLNPTVYATINRPSVMVEIPVMTRYRWELLLLISDWWVLPLLTYHRWELWLPAYFIGVGDRLSYRAYLSCQHLRRWLYWRCI